MTKHGASVTRRTYAARDFPLLEGIRAGDDRRPVHAFPRPNNLGSNRTCEKSGFGCIGEVDIEYPRGNAIRSNDWVVDGDTQVPGND